MAVAIMAGIITVLLAVLAWAYWKIRGFAER